MQVYQKSALKLILPLFLVVSIATIFSSCGIHYYDKETQTEHLWGFGHMKMKVSTPEENVKATIQGTKIIGLGVSKTEDEFALIGGMNDRARAEVVDEDAAVKLEWPDSNLFNLRVGSEPPFLEDDTLTEEPEPADPEE